MVMELLLGRQENALPEPPARRVRGAEKNAQNPVLQALPVVLS
jgi:hypothetical protein